MGKSLPEKFVSKGWGWERWIVNNDKYCGKQLFLAKGKKFSFHFHKVKDETFFIAKGKLTLIFDEIPLEFPFEEFGYPNRKWGRDVYKQAVNSKECVIELEEGDVFHVPVWLAHQVIAQTDVLIYEFSTHHEDNDSYRLVKGD